MLLKAPPVVRGARSGKLRRSEANGIGASMIAESWRAPWSNAVIRRLSWALLGSALGLTSLPGLAALPVEDLYRVAVPVADQGRSERRRAEREAFETVLVRLSGARNVRADETLREALGQPQRYYVAVGYQEVQPGTLVERPVGDLPVTGARARYLLQVRFDPAAVHELLARSELPIWTGTRPEVIAWLGLSDADGDRRLLGADSEHAVVTAMRRRAHRRGLPLLLPLLDLEDRRAVSFAEVWGGFDTAVAYGRERYGADGGLVARVEETSLGRWRADWRGDVDGVRIDLAQEASDPAALGAALIDALADRLAERYGLRLSPERREVLWVQVDEVGSIGAYASLMRYFDSLLGVGDVQLSQVHGRSLLVRVETAGDPERVLDLIRLERRLTLAERPTDSGGVPVWRARWRG